MEQKKIGELIRRLRIEKNMTQLQLAEKICVSDKAVSKWERGCGCPDLSLFGRLSEVLGIDIAALVNGECEENEMINGSMKKLNFYVCPVCGNIICQMGEANVSCCGQKLSAEKAAKATEINCERIENDIYVTSNHEMTKEHYISFAALVTGDTMVMKKLYPEQSFEIRFPFFARGTLFWYCTKHGLMCQDI